MADRTSATPLLALDAVALDTETTSLDPRVARIVEIAAVRLSSGRLNTQDSFRVLVNPGVPMPEIARRVHGIGDDQVRTAPSFIEVWQSLSDRISGTVMIGHSIGFDLAILARETERVGAKFSRPRTLDVCLLAQIVEPALADYSLDSLASWLGVTVTDRHSALGDALTVGRIFVALVPKLRDVKIRTLAEAEAACGRLTAVLDEQHRAGWIEPVIFPSPARAKSEFERLDPYPYQHRVRELMSQPIFVADDISLEVVLNTLAEKQVSSLFVAPAAVLANLPAIPAKECGIVTERDVLRAIRAHGAGILARPCGDFSSRPLISVPDAAFIYRAIGRVNRFRIRHLGVEDEAGVLVGVLTTRDLLRLRVDAAITLGDEIEEAKDVHELGAAWAKLPAVARGLLDADVEARDVAAVISRELAALTHRAAILAEQRMQDAGRGGPPVSYALLVLGSAGRGESLLAMDQDNAIVFERGEPRGPEDNWFAEFGTHVADILHEVGVPYCAGGVMAKNEAWRGSAETWRERIRHWIGRSSPQDLLAVDIFFDFLAVHGDGALAAALWRDAYQMTKGQAAFAKLLAESGADFVPPFGWFGLKTEKGRVDLKKGGLFVIVTTARVLAIVNGIAEHSTKSRIENVRALGLGSESDLNAMIEAQRVILSAILDQQLADIAAGRPPTNKVELKRLSRDDQAKLKDVLASIKHTDEMLRDLLVAQPS